MTDADDVLDSTTDRPLPAALLRTDEILTHPVFRSHHSETAMLRYLRRLADKDVALDRSMILLGSCTMKLNATTEMEPISQAGVRRHPSVRPSRASRGLPRTYRDLETWLAEITGYAAGVAAAERRVTGTSWPACSRYPLTIGRTATRRVMSA